MPIGSRFAKYMSPILDALKDLGGSARPGEVYDWVAEHLAISDLQRAEENQRVLEIIQSLPPQGFERLCQRLLRESGFQQVKVTGRSGDGGIDGIGILQVNPFVSSRYCSNVSDGQVPWVQL
jgi:restriction system protein